MLSASLCQRGSAQLAGQNETAKLMSVKDFAVHRAGSPTDARAVKRLRITCLRSSFCWRTSQVKGIAELFSLNVQVLVNFWDIQTYSAWYRLGKAPTAEQQLFMFIMFQPVVGVVLFLFGEGFVNDETEFV